MLQLFLNVLAGFINLLQVGQEAASIALENLQDEAGTLERPEIANALLSKVVMMGVSRVQTVIITSSHSTMPSGIVLYT